MSTAITDQGRIADSRITVHDVYYYLKRNRPHTEIALILGLFPDEVLAAIGYIEAHKEEVEAVYQRVEERIARGNPPEIQAKLEAAHAKFQQKLDAIRQRKQQEANHARNSGGQ